MTTIEIRESTCDRCHTIARELLNTTGLPKGWLVAYLGLGLDLSGPLKEFCPKCAAVIEEAIRPLERGPSRRHLEMTTQ